MLVARVGENSDVLRFFFATNRRLEPGDASIEERFGTEREQAVQFGFFDTQIKPAVGIGMLINPTQWLQDEEIQLETVQSVDARRPSSRSCVRWSMVPHDARCWS